MISGKAYFMVMTWEELRIFGKNGNMAEIKNFTTARSTHGITLYTTDVREHDYLQSKIEEAFDRHDKENTNFDPDD